MMTMNNTAEKRRRKRWESSSDRAYPAESKNNDNDDSSEAMEEVLQAKMMAPLLREPQDIDDDDPDEEQPAGDQDSQSVATSTNSPIEEVDGAVILVVENGPFDSQKEVIRNRLFRSELQDDNDGTCSDASTAIQDPQTHATDPETPPPGSNQSSRHSSSSSSRSPLLLVNQHQPREQPGATTSVPSMPLFLGTRTQTTPLRRPKITSQRSRSDSLPEAASSSQSKPLSFSNPFTSYSPGLRSASISRRKEIMGMNILTYMHPQESFDDHDNTVRTNHDANDQQHQTPLVDDPGGGASSVATENSEELLEVAAQRIRTDLLQSEMSELAREAERAAENGYDSFAAQPCAFQDDMGTSTQRRKARPELMRRVQSEGAAMHTTTTSSYTSALGSTTTKLRVVELRDVNEVFPSFRQFHTHLRTHFFRCNVSQEELLFDEPKEDGATKQGEGSEQHQQQPSMTTLSTPLPDRSAMLLCKNHTTAADAAAALLPMCANETTATPLPPSDRKCRSQSDASVEGSSVSSKKNDFLSFNFGKWVKGKHSSSNCDRNTNDKSSQEHDEEIMPNDSEDFAFDGYVGDLLSGHLAAGGPPILRPKINIPPGLESLHLSVSATSRLLPKRQQSNPFRDQSYAEWEHKVETQSSHSEPTNVVVEPVRSSSQLGKLHHVQSLPIRLESVEPRALFDNSQFDSDDEEDEDGEKGEDGDSIAALVRPQPTKAASPTRRPVHEIVEQSNNSLVEDESLLREVLTSDAVKALGRTESLRTTESCGDDEGTIHNPIKAGNPDFVTPVHLRTIRGSRTSDFADAGLLLPSNSLAEDSPLRMSKTACYGYQHDRLQQPVLETVLDVSDSLNVSESNHERSTIALPDFMEQVVVNEENIWKDAPAIERAMSTPSPSPVELPVRSPKSDPCGAQSMTLEAAVALNIRSTMTFPFSSAINPPYLPDFSTKVVEKDGLDADDDSAPRTPPTSSLREKCDSFKVVSTPDNDILLPISTPKALRSSPFKFDLPSKSAGSKSLPRSPVTSRSDYIESFLAERFDAQQETTPLQGNVSEPKKCQNESLNTTKNILVPDTPELDISNNCGFLSLSPAPSHESDNDLSKNGHDGKKMSSSRRLRKSTSTGALFDRETSCKDNPGKSIRAAMNMISSLSPKSGPSQRQRALYVRTKENDAFMNNFLYCSRPVDGTDAVAREALCSEPCTEAKTACGEMGSAYCCTSFIERALMMGRLFPTGRHAASNRHLLKLSDSGIRSSHRIDPESWFDMADDRFGCGFDPIWTCTGRNVANPSVNLSFQAPSLKKSNHGRSKHSSKGELVDEAENDPTDEEEDDFDEKKWDGIGLYDIDDEMGVSQRSTERSRRAHHLSFVLDESESSTNFANDADHPHHVLSDRQFQLMYGLSRGSFEAKAKADHRFSTTMETHP